MTAQETDTHGNITIAGANDWLVKGMRGGLGVGNGGSNRLWLEVDSTGIRPNCGNGVGMYSLRRTVP